MCRFVKNYKLCLLLQLLAVYYVAFIHAADSSSFSFKSADTTSKQINPLVEGVVKIDGKPFRAVCNCNKAAMTAEETEFIKNAPVCNPSKVKIHEERPAPTGLTVSDVREMYGQAVDVTFTRVNNHHFSCMDDRISEPTLCTPGGDLGEFLLGLSTLASFSQSKYSEETVTDYLNKYLASTPSNRQFYFCTDDDAVSHIEKSLNIEGLDIVDPALSQQSDIKDSLADPRNVGDSHFRAVSENPQWYQVDSDLPAIVQKSFFNILWDKTAQNRPKLVLDVLPGKRNPKAFLEIYTTHECEIADIAPLLRPKKHAVSAILNHMAAVKTRRKEIADFFVKNSHINVSVETFYSRMERYGLKSLEATGMRIAKDLPFYRLDYV